MKSDRTIKIQPRLVSRTYDTVTIPELLLKGKWLEESGFKPGQNVRVELHENKLIITHS